LIVCCRRVVAVGVVVVVVGMHDHPLTTTIKQDNTTITNTIAILFGDDDVHRLRMLFEQCIMMIRIFPVLLFVCFVVK